MSGAQPFPFVNRKLRRALRSRRFCRTAAGVALLAQLVGCGSSSFFNNAPATHPRLKLGGNLPILAPASIPSNSGTLTNGTLAGTTTNTGTISGGGVSSALSGGTVQPSPWSHAVTLGNASQDALQLDVRGFGAAVNANSATPTDDAAALTAAYGEQATLWNSFGVPACVTIPPPGIYLNSSITQPGDGVPFCVKGSPGPEFSHFALGTGFPGAVMQPDDNWQNGQTAIGSTSMLMPSTIASITSLTAGATILDIGCFGNQAAASPQYCIQPLDYNDFGMIWNVTCYYMADCLKFGDYSTKSIGVWREGLVGHVKAIASGLSGGYAFDISSNCTLTGCSITAFNNDTFIDLRSYAAQGGSMRLCSNSTGGAAHDNHFYDVTLEQDLTPTNGDLLDIGGGSGVCPGQIENTTFVDTIIANPPTGDTGVLINCSGCGTATPYTGPFNIQFQGLTFKHAANFAGNDLDIEVGKYIQVSGFNSQGTAGTNITIGAGVLGPIDIDAGLGTNAYNTSISGTPLGAGNVDIKGHALACSAAPTLSGVTPPTTGGTLTTGSASCDITFNGRNVDFDENITFTAIAGSSLTGGAGTLDIGAPVTTSSTMGEKYCSGAITSNSASTPPGGSGYPLAQIGPGSNVVTIDTFKPASTAVTAWGGGNIFVANTTIIYTATFTCHVVI